jgi:lysophospholipase L1-like esterase
MTHVYCFGDSISYGEGDPLSGGWVDRLKSRCSASDKQSSSTVVPEQPEFTVFNLGIPGETTDGLRQRIKPEFERRHVRATDSIVVLNYGANDIVIHQPKKPVEDLSESSKQQKSVVPLAYFERNIGEAIKFSLSKQATVILLGLLPVCPRYDGVSNQFEQVKFDSSVNSYNLKLEQMAQQSNVICLDLYTEFSESFNRIDEHQGAQLFSDDKVHPNAEGHALIANKLAKLIQQICIDE